MSHIKNIAASTKARLQNVAAKRGENFNQLLVRYGIERLLYRLSLSRYADHFLLKGAMLFIVWDDKPHRPTRDLDLLGFVPAEKQEMLRIFREIVTTPVKMDDGLTFAPSAVTTEDIRTGTEFGGIRIKLTARLGTAKIPMQVDVGAGDTVTPEAEEITFPCLLDFPAPRIRAYPVYTVISEKFAAAVTRRENNSRMKDFYDLCFLSRRFVLDRATLKAAIEATFANNRIKIPRPPEPYTDALANDPNKQIQWNSFLRRNGLAEGAKPFPEVIKILREFFTPLTTAEQGKEKKSHKEK